MVQSPWGVGPLRGRLELRKPLKVDREPTKELSVRKGIPENVRRRALSCRLKECLPLLVVIGSPANCTNKSSLRWPKRFKPSWNSLNNATRISLSPADASSMASPWPAASRWRDCLSPWSIRGGFRCRWCRPPCWPNLGGAALLPAVATRQVHASMVRRCWFTGLGPLKRCLRSPAWFCPSADSRTMLRTSRFASRCILPSPAAFVQECLC
jgi:hypothetical protein